jgi:hypothetical protein
MAEINPNLEELKQKYIAEALENAKNIQKGGWTISSKLDEYKQALTNMTTTPERTTSDSNNVK